MIVNRLLVLDFLHLDTESEEREYLDLLIDNADQFLRDCVDDYDKKYDYEIDTKFKKKADLLQLMIIQNMYDNRDFTTISAEKLRFSVLSMLRQLQYGKYPTGD